LVRAGREHGHPKSFPGLDSGAGGRRWHRGRSRRSRGVEVPAPPSNFLLFWFAAAAGPWRSRCSGQARAALPVPAVPLGSPARRGFNFGENPGTGPRGVGGIGSGPPRHRAGWAPASPSGFPGGRAFGDHQDEVGAAAGFGVGSGRALPSVAPASRRSCGDRGLPAGFGPRGVPSGAATDTGGGTGRATAAPSII